MPVGHDSSSARRRSWGVVAACARRDRAKRVNPTSAVAKPPKVWSDAFDDATRSDVNARLLAMSTIAPPSPTGTIDLDVIDCSAARLGPRCSARMSSTMAVARSEGRTETIASTSSPSMVPVST
jgi:hypothetical protein